jgi:hypothetical protein
MNADLMHSASEHSAAHQSATTGHSPGERPSSHEPQSHAGAGADADVDAGGLTAVASHVPASASITTIVELGENGGGKRQLAADLASYVRGLYAREELADFSFAVSNAAHQALVSTFRVHRLVVCARCPALATLIAAEQSADACARIEVCTYAC